MSDLVLVEGTSINLIADQPVIALTQIISLLVLSSIKLAVTNLKAAVETDMSSQLPVVFPYNTTTHTIPGTLTWDGILEGYDKFDGLKKDDVCIITDLNGGTVTFTVLVPAQQPGSPPVPDPQLQYGGTWAIINNPNNKLTVR